MREKLKQYSAKFDALSPREKGLVLATTAIAILVGWFLLLSEPMYLNTKEQQIKIDATTKEISALNTQLQSLQQRKNDDPHRDLKQRIAQLDTHLARIDVDLREKFHGLIEPREMASVLESVLRQHKDLVLIRVQSLEAVPLIGQLEEQKDTDSDKAQQVEVYRHGMQVEFEGSYLATLDYLKTLEKLPWEFYWDAVQLDVKDYPKSRIIITVHTLSLRDAWIGV